MNEQPSADAPSSSPDREILGQVWKDRYVIDKELGRGGFGVVYLARDRHLLSKPVVIKVLREESSPNPYFEKKFRQEIEALARIDHPGIVGVFDVGETPQGRPFLVMQFVEGATLRAEIPAGGMDFRRVAHILRQVTQALGAAHEKGVFHRDLKPENIMLQRTGDSEEYVKLIDFGVASVRDSQVPAQSQTSKVMGTLAYMAPEQVMGIGGAESDVYALGVIAYEMLTGQRPEMSPQGPSSKPRDLRPDIPQGAQEAILRALSYLPENRQARPREFGDQLVRAMGIEPVISSPLPSGAATALSLQPKRAPSGPASSSSAALEMAYVLFMDLVGYSTLPMDLQSHRIQHLGDIVRDTPEFQRAQESDQIISLPTGDGMALVFFQNPVAPVQCAVEICRALKPHPELQLRMGVHTGPVYRIPDINTNRNVAGGGINLAARVMDCGDSGHVLVSKAVAEVLVQLSDWAPALHDLGEVEVKHGVKVHVVNLFTGEVGNPNLPEKLQQRSLVPAAPRALTVAEPTPPQPPAPAPVTEIARARPNNDLYLAGGGAAAILLALALLQFGPWRRGGQHSGEQRDSTKAAAAILPAPQGTPPAVTTSAPAAVPPSAPPAGPPSSTAPAPRPEPPQIPPAASRRAPVEIAQPSSPAKPIRAPVAAQQAAPTAVRGLPPAPAPTRDAAPTAPERESRDSADRALLQQLRERLILVASRASAVSKSMQTMEDRQRQQGLGMRADMASARESMNYFVEEARSSLAEGDAAAAKRNLDLAEGHLEKIERFLGR